LDTFIKEFVALLENRSRPDITGDTAFKDVPGWDSLVALSLIVMISNVYGKSIDGETIRSCHTIRDLYEAINA
jgi:acyl carrier protein